jgi:hypothetical protein
MAYYDVKLLVKTECKYAVYIGKIKINPLRKAMVWF